MNKERLCFDLEGHIGVSIVTNYLGKRPLSPMNWGLLFPEVRFSPCPQLFHLGSLDQKEKHTILSETNSSARERKWGIGGVYRRGYHAHAQSAKQNQRTGPPVVVASIVVPIHITIVIIPS